LKKNEGGENMSNLPISPAIVVPGVQVLEDFPTIGTTNFQSDSQKSDFSKTLEDVVKTHQSKPKQTIKASKKDNTNSEADSFNSRPQTAVKINEQDQQQKPTVCKANKSESKPADTDSQDLRKAETTSKLSDNSDGKLSESPDKGNQNTDITSSGIVTAMTAPVFVNQVLPVETGIQNETPNIDKINNVTPGVNATTSEKTSPDVGVTKTGNTIKGQTLDFAAMLDASNQTVVNNQPQLKTTAPSMPVAPVLQNAATQPGVAQNLSALLQQTPVAAKYDVTSAAAQNFQAQTNVITSAGASQNQAPQNQSTAVSQKTKDVNNFKSSELTKGKTVEAQTSIVDLQTGKALKQTSNCLKGIDNGAFIMNAVKDNQHSASNEKGVSLGDSLVVTQTASNDGKAHTLNMPVIQTQLSVNNSNDKTRDDIAIVSDVHSQQINEVGADTAKPAVTHVNKDDLFAQIIEKAKVSIKNGNGEMEVNLKPDHLGKLHLKVSVENQIVTAKFMAESQQVKEVIETNLNQLRRNLQDTGIQVDQLMVSVGQQNNDSSFQQASHNSGGFSDHKGSSFMRQEISGSSKEHSHERSSRRDTVIDLIA
jgi:flagellar hook-length control protein FliK